MKKISVIIPTYNEEKRISKCLESIRSQSYPKKYVEIIIVDDKSSDNTLKIAKKYNCKVYTNGTHNIERAKSIGVKKSRGDYCLFVDSDNTLVDPHWLRSAVSILNKYPQVAAVQAEFFYYSSKHSLITQYCDLFGINDPLALYLGKRGQKMHVDEKFPVEGQIIFDSSVYSIVRFTKLTLPPIGSQGYLIRRSLIKKTNWEPYMFHIDTAYELVDMGIDTFAYLKSPVEHEYANSISDIKNKLQRNLTLFLQQSSQRVYKYNINLIKLVFSCLLMVTIIHPLIVSTSLFIRNPKKAWFVHPFICFLQIFWYLEIYCKYYMGSKFRNRLSEN